MDESTRQAMRLWTLVQPNVSAFVTSLVRDFHDRDDVLQDIAVTVVESFESYDDERPFIAWALGIARNRIRMYFRQKGRDRQVFGEATVDRLEAAFAELSRSDSDKFELLQECVGKLDGRARQFCEIRYRQDLKPAAIGELLGMNANAVAKALQRIRDQLRDCIERKSAAVERPS